MRRPTRRFRTRYREMFGAHATQDPLYQAVSEGRRLAGMDHWLPLFEDKLASLFDHLSKDDLVVIDAAALQAAEDRHTPISVTITGSERRRQVTGPQAPIARSTRRRFTCRPRNLPGHEPPGPSTAR